MKLKLRKSFRLIKLLNKNQPAVLRGPAAVVIAAITWAVTARFALAREMYHRCWHHNDFKLAARREAWYFRRGWINLDVSKDNYFDFTEDMTDAQLDVLEQFVTAAAPRLAPLKYHADMVFIAARRLDNDTDPAKRAVHVRALHDASNLLLAQAQPASDTPQDKPRKGDFPIADAKQTMGDFIALFPPDQVPWFVVSGTFLGLVRENGFLPHDYDIDLGLFEDQADVPALMAAIAASDRFVLKKYDHHTSSLVAAPVDAKDPDVPYILKINHVSGVHIDLFFHYRDTSKTPAVAWHGTSLHRWENAAFELARYPFYGWEVFGPADADGYLSENYGDWRTPVTDFNCTTDTPNLTLVPHPIAVAIFLKRFVLTQGRDAQAADQLQAALIDNGFLVASDTGSYIFNPKAFGASV